jgi:hypothetical protein
MSLKAFRRAQISNVEGTPGTAEAAVEVLPGTILYDDGVTIHRPEEDRNNLAANMADDVIAGREAHLTWAFDLNFRHICWALAMSICGNITPTQPDAMYEPNAYLWTFTPALTADGNTPDQTDGIDTFTIECGDASRAYEVEFAFGTRIEISGAPNEVVKVSVEITGRQVTSGITFTAALTAQSVQKAPFNLSKVYIDTSWANLGTTQVTGMVKGITWALDTMFTASYGPDGNLYFTSLDEDRKAPEITLVLKRNSDALTEETAWENRTTRFIRWEILGTTELDGGESNPPYLHLDTACRYFEWPRWGDENGRTTIEAKAEGVYDSTGSAMFEAAVKTALDAYP